MRKTVIPFLLEGRVCCHIRSGGAPAFCVGVRGVCRELFRPVVRGLVKGKKVHGGRLGQADVSFFFADVTSAFFPSHFVRFFVDKILFL